MLGSILGLGKFGYGTIYAVPATYMYLYIQVSAVRLPYTGWVLSESVIIALLVVSCYSAIWIHRTGLLIFGDSGGLNSTKSQKVINRQLAYFATGVQPVRLPESSSILELFSAAADSGEANTISVVRFIPAALYFVYLFISWVLLSNYLIQEPSGIAAGALWLVLTVLLWKKVVTGYLPHYTPRSSISGFEEAEYARNRRMINSSDDTVNQPRIDKDSKQTRRIR